MPMEVIKTKKIRLLTAELLGRSIRNLSVIDRLRCERVSPRWLWVVGEFGWTEQKKMDRSSVFEGTTPENAYRFRQRFYNLIGGGNCNFVSFLGRISSNLVELNLASFDGNYVGKLVPNLAESLQTMKKLEKLNIENFDFANFVPFLPSNLRQLKTSVVFTIETLKTLSVKCPKLEEIPFHRVVDCMHLDTVGEFIRGFPRQKKLNLAYGKFHWYGESRTLASLAGLKELEVLELPSFSGFNADTFEAMVTGCTKLRKLRFEYIWSGEALLAKASFLHLAKMPNLSVLVVGHDYAGVLTDFVLKEIAKRRKLKKLVVWNTILTDESIVYLIDRCKSLVSLHLFGCTQITERSLEAVIAEVHRRYESPPRALPTGPGDLGIFYFDCRGTRIREKRALVMASNNPWLALNEIDGKNFDSRVIV